MARKAHSTPPLRLHKASGQGYVFLAGTRVYLGKYDDPATAKAYARTLAEFASNGGRMPIPKEEITMLELCDRYLEHAKLYYRLPNGKESTEFKSVVLTLRELVLLYGDIPAAEFGPLKLQAFRRQWIDKGLCRSTINGRTGIIKRLFRWSVTLELVPVAVFQALDTVEGLRQGRSAAREPQKVLPVLLSHVDAVRPFVSRQVWGLIQLQLLTGARSGEVLNLRRTDLNTSGPIWTAQLDHHKTSHRGKARTLYFGAKAQEVLREFFPGKGPAEFLFSPADAERERLEKRHAARVTALSCGNRPGTNKADDPRVTAGNRYDVNSYRRAIQRACEQAGVPRWHPHQLRHTAATRIRKELGLEAAQVWLGHSNADVTQVYAEVDHARALDIAARMG